MTNVNLLNANAVKIPLADKSVQTVITSPPYWGLRFYGDEDGMLGLESTPDEYIANMVAVGREIWRVLRDDGTLWMNLGDSYNSGGGYSPNAPSNQDGRSLSSRMGQRTNTKQSVRHQRAPNLKHKDLCGIPWRVALAFQADGWYLRSDIIWHKPNPMPESVTDRPTKAHEYVFLLTKRARYFYDADAVREKVLTESLKRAEYSGANDTKWHKSRGVRGGGVNDRACLAHGPNNNPAGRNRRTVWTIATQPYSGAHFATFPEKLVEPMIKAGTSERGCCPECGAAWERVVEKSGISTYERMKQQYGLTHEDMHEASRLEGRNLKAGAEGWGHTRGPRGTVVSFGSRESTTTGFSPTCECSYECPTHDLDPIPSTILDPFCGSGTTGVVARRLGRNFVGLDLSAEYLQLARQRLGLTALDAWNAGTSKATVDTVDDLPLFGGAI